MYIFTSFVLVMSNSDIGVSGFFMNQFLLSRYSIISFSSIQFSVNILLYNHIVNILLYWCQPVAVLIPRNQIHLNPFSYPNPGILLNPNLYPGFSKYGTVLRHFAESGCGSLDLDPDIRESGSRQKFTVVKILLKTLYSLCISYRRTRLDWPESGMDG